MTVIGIIMLLWIAAQGLTVLGVGNYLYHLPHERQAENPGGVVVILSVRDDWNGAPELIAALRAQDSGDFRLMIATSGKVEAALALATHYPGWVELIVAGVADGEGQKVHKLRAALAALRPDDRYIVLIDTDILPPARLVGRLLFPLVRGKAEIATGYRMLLPSAGRPLLSLVSAVEMQLATLPRPAARTMPWGGAMAMGRDVAERLKLVKNLAGRLSDDLTIGLAARATGMRLRPVRDLLVATPLEGSTGSAFAFAIRQYRHVRFNSVRMWSASILVVAAQSAGWLWAIMLGGWAAVAVGYGAAWLRVMMRAAIMRAVLEPGQWRATWRSLAWDGITPFIVTWIHLGIMLVAACSRNIRWGGYEYRMRGGRVERMRKVVQKPAGN